MLSADEERGYFKSTLAVRPRFGTKTTRRKLTASNRLFQSTGVFMSSRRSRLEAGVRNFVSEGSTPWMAGFKTSVQRRKRTLRHPLVLQEWWAVVPSQAAAPHDAASAIIVLEQEEELLLRKIYVSDSGDDKDNGLTSKTPVRSWQRFIELCEGNDEIIIMGADTVRMRLIAEIDKKSRTSQMPAPAS